MGLKNFRCLLAITILELAISSGSAYCDPGSLPAIPWDSSRQGSYVTALCGDRHGDIWAGTESTGVWRYEPLMERWTQFTQANTNGGLGDDDVYSLVCNRLGRVWCGTGRDGVSVFNSKNRWETYDRTTGPLGCHVVALATSPITGDVWGCTENGVFEYSIKSNTWRYFTRANGLPSDQTDCLCFDKVGTVYVGTLCDGIAIASRTDDYHKWRVVTGPRAIPNSPDGNGLPSALINCLLAARDGTIFAGTTTGLALSIDGGLHWRFLRGLDWKDKLAGLYSPVAPEEYDTGVHLLTEDYVTAMAEDPSGRLYVGHRQRGLQVYDADLAADVTPSGAYGGYVNALLSTRGGLLLIGTYGDGLAQTNWESPAIPSTAIISAADLPALPSPASPPTVTQLKAMLQEANASQTTLQIGRAVLMGEDWQTQGDSLGRYGRQYTVLCAADAPLDHDVVSDPTYDVQIGMGPHHAPGDSIRRWVTWAQTDNSKSLYDPIPGYRRQSESDDHGESMVGANDSFAYDGPDIWATVSVPAGLHRVSVYDFNKDGGPGGGGDNRFRDYIVDILEYHDDPDIVQREAPLARGRIRNFWGGVYESFLVRGPAKYVVRVAKNGSFNTILAGVFIDRIGGPPTRRDCAAWMGGVRYAPPDPDAPIPIDPHLLDKLLATGGGSAVIANDPPNPTALDAIAAARALWEATAPSTKFLIDPFQQPIDRLEAYRAVVHCGASAALQGRWRWMLDIWTPADRNQFDATMQQAHASLLALNPDMLNHSY